MSLKKQLLARENAAFGKKEVLRANIPTYEKQASAVKQADIKVEGGESMMRELVSDHGSLSAAHAAEIERSRNPSCIVQGGASGLKPGGHSDQMRANR